MKLKTETNTPCMERKVRGAFCGFREEEDGPWFSADFEHGQWWITDLETGAQWSVNDAEGGDEFDGFYFDQVTEGDDR